METYAFWRPPVRTLTFEDFTTMQKQQGKARGHGLFLVIVLGREWEQNWRQHIWAQAKPWVTPVLLEWRVLSSLVNNQSITTCAKKPALDAEFSPFSEKQGYVHVYNGGEMIISMPKCSYSPWYSKVFNNNFIYMPHCSLISFLILVLWRRKSSVQTIGMNCLNLTVRRRSLQAHLKLATYAPSFSAEHLERHDTCLKLMCWVNFCLALFCAFPPVSPFSGSSGWEASDFSKDDSWADLNSFPQSVALPTAGHLHLRKLPRESDTLWLSLSLTSFHPKATSVKITELTLFCHRAAINGTLSFEIVGSVIWETFLGLEELGLKDYITFLSQRSFQQFARYIRFCNLNYWSLSGFKMKVIKRIGVGGRPLRWGSYPQSFLALWPWPSSPFFLTLSFLICRMEKYNRILVRIKRDSTFKME